MLSRISKMSVFGIVALMLVLGLASDDAQGRDPAAGTYVVTMQTEPSVLRAADTATVTFTLTVDLRENKSTQDPIPEDQANADTAERTVTINIPGGSTGWSPNPVALSGETAVDPGEVSFAKTTVITDNTLAWISGSNARKLNIKIVAGIDGNGVYTIVYAAATVPNRKGDSYRFLIDNADTKDIPYSVDYATSGSGTVTMSPYSPLDAIVGGDADDKNAWNGKYVFNSKTALRPLKFTYKAAGSMPKDSTVSIVMTGGFSLHGKSSSVISVSGSGSPELSTPVDTVVVDESTTVVATVKAEGGLGAGQSIAITIRELVMPEVVAAADAPDTDNTITVTSTSGTTNFQDDARPVAIDNAAGDVDKGLFEFYTTAAPGTGEMTINSGGDPIQNMRVVEGTDLGTLVFGITGTDGMGPDAKFQIKVPGAPWPEPIKASGTIGVVADSEAAGHTANAEIGTGGAARTLSGSLTTNTLQSGTNNPEANANLNDTDNGGITYRAGAISVHGKHEFMLLTSSGPHGATLKERTGGDGADAYPRYIEVTAKHESGTFVVREGGSPLVQSKPANEHTLQLVFKATGYMPAGMVVFRFPDRWKSPRRDVAPPFEVGEVRFSNNATFIVNTDGTITATGDWRDEEIVVTYRGMVPGEAGTPPESHTFTVDASSFGGDASFPAPAARPAAYSHTIGPNLAADGSGTLAIEPKNANAGETINLNITYTAAGTMEDGSVVEVTIPEGWPDLDAPGTSVEIGAEGIVATLNESKRTLTATTVDDMVTDSKLVFNVTGVTAPAVGRGYQFTAQSKSHGELKSLSSRQISGAVINISNVAAGSALLTLVREDGTMAESAEPLDSFETAKITFTVGLAMQPGAEVRVTVPDGWTNEPFQDNGMPRTSGEVTLEGKADLSVEGSVLIAKANAQINPGETVTFTYHKPTAPEGETTSSFDTQASIVEGGGLLAVANQQTTVVVRSKVTALTLTAESATSVFVGDPVKLTVSSDARAPVRGLAVTLATDPADTGMFSLTEDGTATTSVTIEDSATTMSTTFYYIGPSSIDTASVDVELTATAMVDGEAVASDPVEVNVRSTISMLQVNGMHDDPEPVEVGAAITVTAIGKDGRATVTVTDAEEEAVESLTNLGLDVDSDATDVPAGSVAYKRKIELPDDLAEGDYTVTVTIDGVWLPIEISVVAARAQVTELTLTASADNFFAGESITVTVASDARAPVDGLEVTLSTDPADSGTFSDPESEETLKGGMVTIEDAADSMSADVNYTNSARGTFMLTATAMVDGEAVTSDPLEVTVNPTITVQVNGMDAPEAVLPGATISVTASGKAGGGTVMVTDAEGEAVESLTGLGLNVDADAADVPEGSVAYMRDIELPADIADGTYTVTVTIGSESVPVMLEVMTPTEPVTAIAIVPDPTSVFIGEDIAVSVTLWSGAEEGAASAAMVINLTDGEAGGSFTDTEGNAITSVTIAVGGFDASAKYSNASRGEITLTATAADEALELEPATADVTVKPSIYNFEVNGTDELGPLTAGVTITVSATGKEGKATVTVTDADGEGVVPSKGLTGLDEEPDEEGNVDYTRKFDLPVVLADGIYTVTVTIAGETAAMAIEIINDQSKPALSNQKVLPDTVASGSVITLRIDVSSNVPNPELSVMADVSEIDADQAAVQLTKLPGTESTYANIYVVKNSDPQDDGEKTITFMATDRIGGASEMTVSTSLKNDVTPPVLSDPTAMPSPVVNGMDVTISVSSESGLTVTADASEIGGGMVTLTEGTVDDGMDANGNGNGMDANGNGNGMDANGNGNGMDANGNGNGMDANGNGNGMDEDMVGTGMYSSDPITVAVTEGGDQTITVKATDASGNEATIDVTVTVEVHEVTSVTFVRTGDTVTVTTMGTAGLKAEFSVFNEAMKIIGEKAMTESDDGGSYTGSFIIVVDAHPAGEYWISSSVGTAASMTAEGALTIDHGAHFTLSIGAGTHIIHIPLDVKQINGEDALIDTVGDLYDALGEAVNYIITVGDDGGWKTYLGDMSAGTAADAAIGDDTGLIVVMSDAKTLELVGDALGTAGASQINIDVGNNLVGVPLDPVVDMMISAALVEGVSSISVSKADGMGFHTIREPGDDGDGPVIGGVGYLVSYIGAEPASIPIFGSAWENDGSVSAAPAIAFSGSQTPVLYVEGGVMDEFDMLSRVPELRVTVKNLSTGASLDTVLGTEQSATAYSGTFVELSRHAAKAGDVLEIVAHSPNPYVGVRPVQQIVVSAEEVLTSRISLPDLEVYEIPSESELLANYPNPFNPETWIPYRLAKAAEVTLDIYDTNGRLVRTIDIGFKPAAVYESRASAIYWDGRNNYGERVASGTYFYHLTAGDDYASTRRMVILK